MGLLRERLGSERRDIAREGGSGVKACRRVHVGTVWLQDPVTLMGRSGDENFEEGMGSY